MLMLLCFSCKEEKSDTQTEITEIIIHPTINPSNVNNYKEFMAIKSPKLKQEILDLGFKLTNYSEFN